MYLYTFSFSIQKDVIFCSNFLSLSFLFGYPIFHYSKQMCPKYDIIFSPCRILLVLFLSTLYYWVSASFLLQCDAILFVSQFWYIVYLVFLVEFAHFFITVCLFCFVFIYNNFFIECLYIFYKLLCICYFSSFFFFTPLSRYLFFIHKLNCFSHYYFFYLQVKKCLDNYAV